jgi:hypothetical protein
MLLSGCIQAPKEYRSLLGIKKNAPPPSDPGNLSAEVHGETRSNDTHQSTPDPEALLAKKGQGKEAKSAFFGGNTCEGTYSHSLDSCVKAAEDAAKRLNLATTNREVKDGTAIVDARESNSTPVQFEMKKVDEGTKVTFIAGREKTEGTRDLANRMKAEFENCCTAKGN